MQSNMLKPAGFWSYHRPDGQRSRGWLADLHRALVDELENRLGTRHDVSMFRDETMHIGAALMWGWLPR